MSALFWKGKQTRVNEAPLRPNDGVGSTTGDVSALCPLEQRLNMTVQVGHSEGAEAIRGIPYTGVGASVNGILRSVARSARVGATFGHLG